MVEEGLGNASYLVDVGDGRALVIDPERDPRPYLAEADRRNLRVAWAAETHVHADFVSGATALAAHGATIVAARSAGLGFAHRGLDDGGLVDLGGLVLEVLATPGHTPAHVAFVLRDGPRPLGVFSGGALIVGGAARTDLAGEHDTERWARASYRSVRDRLLALPDHVPLYPTHGPGSFCSTAVSGARTSTIGAERRANPLLAGDADEDTFVARLLGGLGSYPAYFAQLPALNQAGPSVLEPWPTLAQLSVAQLHEAFDHGADLIDVRPVDEFAAGHVPGSLSIELRPQFQSWLGWLVELGRPLTFIAGAHQDRAELVRQCLNIGHSKLVGELTGGIETWTAAGLARSTIPLINAVDLDPAEQILDIRQASEWTVGHIPGAHHVELGALRGADALGAALTSAALTSTALAETERGAEPLAVMCAHGQRSMTAASLLARHGHHRLEVLRDGVEEWATASGIPPATGK